MSERSVVGSIVSIWRYPVKSMMGEELNSSELAGTGVLGDRAFAIIDSETNKVASAKNPRKWPHLFDYRAAYVEPPRSGESLPPVRITMPDGSFTTSDDPRSDDFLSVSLGRKVRLRPVAPENPRLEEYWPDIEGLDHRETVTEEAMPQHSFFDGAKIHVLTTATIDQLRELYPKGRFEVRRFRPNIVLQTADGQTGFVENSWVGHTLTLGDGARLNIIRICPRCVMTTLPQGDLPKDVGILKTAAKHNGAGVGVYADVAQSATIRRGEGACLDH